MKYKTLIVGVILLLVGIGLITISTRGTTTESKIKEVPCYDKYDNVMANLICQNEIKETDFKVWQEILLGIGIAGATIGVLMTILGIIILLESRGGL